MRISTRGRKHIRDRVTMPPEDVASIISGGAVVSLGKNGASEFLLFHSPPDASAKIAVVSPDRKVLISVWDDNSEDFVPPPSLQPVTPALKEEAKRLLREFLIGTAA